MPAHKKGLTEAFPLRLTTEERALALLVVDDYRQCDIKISINDAFRILLRRGAEDHPVSLDGVKSAIVTHWDECRWCDESRIACPEGRRLRRYYERLLPDPAPAPAPKRARPARLLPPPPGVRCES